MVIGVTFDLWLKSAISTTTSDTTLGLGGSNKEPGFDPAPPHAVFRHPRPAHLPKRDRQSIRYRAKRIIDGTAALHCFQEEVMRLAQEDGARGADYRS